ncbi:MAG: TolB family protein, partial [Gemmatimonadaceae bacterium]
MRIRAGGVAAVVLALGMVVGCSDSTEPSAPDLPTGAIAELAAVTPTAVTGAVGAAIDPSPSVRVMRRETRMPMMGVPVTFEFTTGQSTVQRVAHTDGEGVASAAWTLGTVAGIQRITARSSATGSASIVFTATATAGPVASVAAYIDVTRERGSGDLQSAPIGSTLPYPLSLIVRDQFNNAISGATVTFAVLSGGGRIEGATAVTSSTGVASSGSWTLGATPGTQQVRARVGAVDMLFSAEACMTTCAARAQLAFVRGGNIYSMMLDGTVIQLTATGNNNDPAWSPDGGRIAFTRFHGNVPDIYVMNADGS